MKLQYSVYSNQQLSEINLLIRSGRCKNLLSLMTKMRLKGRGDLFVMFRKDEINCDILFEAKRLGKYIPTEESKAKEKSWAKRGFNHN